MSPKLRREPRIVNRLGMPTLREGMAPVPRSEHENFDDSAAAPKDSTTGPNFVATIAYRILLFKIPSITSIRP